MSMRNYGSSPIETAQQVAVMNLQGELGFTFINDTAAHVPALGKANWRSIQCIADCTFSVLTASNQDGINSLSSITLAAGSIIYGSFTAITLGGGSVLAYY